MGGKDARGDRSRLLRQESRALQQRRTALQSHAFLEMDEAPRRRKDSRRPGEGARSIVRIRREGERRLDRGGNDAVRFRLGLADGGRRQDRRDQDPQRRKPARSQRGADSRNRRLGTLLLYRLSQPPSRLPKGFRRKPGQLGIWGGTLSRREQVTRTLSVSEWPGPSRPFRCGEPGTHSTKLIFLSVHRSTDASSVVVRSSNTPCRSNRHGLSCATWMTVFLPAPSAPRILTLSPCPEMAPSSSVRATFREFVTTTATEGNLSVLGLTIFGLGFGFGFVASSPTVCPASGGAGAVCS